MCKNALDNAIDWFYQHRKIDFETGCWELDTGLRGSKGQEQYIVSRLIIRDLGWPVQTQAFYARRFSACLFKGLDPTQKVPIYVTCANPHCCNYEHLSIGRYPLATKVCSRCERTLKAKTDFYWYCNKPSSWCKDCVRAYVRAWNKKATEKRHTLNRKLDRKGLRKREEHQARRLSMRSGTVSLLRILQRDCGICHICLKPIENLEGNMHFDHVIPLSRGGLHQESNIKLAHSACNQWKGVALLEELELLGLSEVRKTGVLPSICYSRLEMISGFVSNVHSKEEISG